MSVNINRNVAFKASLAAGVLVLTSTLAACGSSSSGGQSGAGGPEIWGISDPALTSAIDHYNKDHPNGHISDDMETGGDQLDTKLQPAIAARHLPDVFEVYKPTELAKLAKEGLILDMSSSLKSSGLADRFPQSIQSLMQVDGKFYGVPVSQMNTMTFFYNKSIFAKAGVAPPQTWSQLVAEVSKLKRASSGSCAIAFDGGDTFAAENYQQSLLAYVGGLDAVKSLTTGKQNVWQSSDLAKTDSMLEQLLATKPFEYGAGAIKQSSGTPYELVGSGKCGMYLTGDYGYGGFKQYAPKILKAGDLGWFPFPVASSAQVSQPPIIDAGAFNMLVVSSKSSHEKQDLDFLEHYMFTPSYVSTALSNSYVPVVKGIGSQVAKSSVYNKYIYDLEQKASGFSLNVKDQLPPAISTQYQNQSTALMLGRSSPDQFASAMTAAAKDAGL